jgi:ribosomal protein L37AE/L43A
LPKPRQEGFPEVAAVFEAVAVAEKYHEHRYATLAANLENNRVFQRDAQVTWRCRNCGYTVEGHRLRPCAPPAPIPRPILSSWMKITSDNFFLTQNNQEVTR